MDVCQQISDAKAGSVNTVKKHPSGYSDSKSSGETFYMSLLTDVEDRQLGHHWNFIHISIAGVEGPHLGVLGLEARLP